MTVQAQRIEPWQQSAARVGQAAPHFELDCVELAVGLRRRIRLTDHAGQWLVLLFCPHEAIFGCGTELASFSSIIEDFRRRNCAVLVVGRESLAEYEQHFRGAEAKRSLPRLRFPLASDADGEIASAYGVSSSPNGPLTRGLFVIDPKGVLQYEVLHHVCVGRSSDEVLRVIDALRAGGLCAMREAVRLGLAKPPLALGPDGVLGHYRVEHELGEGGFGRVFRAWDLRLERRVALKLLRPGSATGRERILAEARAAARLNHPNLCTIYAVEDHSGQPLIAMEFVPGHSLAKRIRTEGALSVPSVRSIATQVAWGIMAAHAENVVHGDLKPGNIMLTEQGVVKVLDFGLAAWHVGGAPPSRPRPEHPPQSIRFRGTAPYMSLEHALGEPLVTASDVFTFGLVLYEMLTAKRLNSAKEPAAAARVARREDLASRAAVLPDPFRVLVAQCLHPSPAERPTMGEIADRLHPF